MLTYQRLKVHLLKTSNQEAQFRLDLENKISIGIWNHYDIKENVTTPSPSSSNNNSNSNSMFGNSTQSINQSKQGYDGADFVVYQRAKSSPRSLPKNQSPKQMNINSQLWPSSPSHIPNIQSSQQMRIPQNIQGGGNGSGSVGGGSSTMARDRSGSFERTITYKNKGKRTSGKFEKNQVLPLTEWLLKHSTNPYPTMEDKAELARESGLSTQQVQNWFINMRKRHWTPMMNGKRRPRTFLDYVILSSQQGEGAGQQNNGGLQTNMKTQGVISPAQVNIGEPPMK